MFTSSFLAASSFPLPTFLHFFDTLSSMSSVHFLVQYQLFPHFFLPSSDIFFLSLLCSLFSSYFFFLPLFLLNFSTSASVFPCFLPSFFLSYCRSDVIFTFLQLSHVSFSFPPISITPSPPPFTPASFLNGLASSGDARGLLIRLRYHKLL